MKKHPGIRVRHGRACNTGAGRRCNCNPSYEAFVFSARESKKIRRSFPTYSAAKHWRSDALGEVRRGKLKAPTQATLGAAWETWIEAARRGEHLSRKRLPYKPSVLRSYDRDMRCHVLADLGPRKLCDLRAEDLQALINRLNGLGLSGSRVRNVLMPLHVLYRCHHREVAVDPTEGLDLPAAGGRRERVASPQEAAALIEALPVDLQALYAAACYGGLRRGELRALRASDVDYPAATVIRVERAWDDVEGEVGPKSAKGKRLVPVAGALRRYLLAHKLATGRAGDDFLFGRSASEPFTPTAVRRRALNAWAGANVERAQAGEPPLQPLGLHEARHTYVTLMAAAGTPLLEIGDFVGHSSAYMVDRYRHLLDGQREQAAERLDTYLAGAFPGAQPR
jgi:integrase